MVIVYWLVQVRSGDILLPVTGWEWSKFSVSWQVGSGDSLLMFIGWER